MNCDYCIHDRFEQCFHDCENCPRADISEPDTDFIYDMIKEEMMYD